MEPKTIKLPIENFRTKLPEDFKLLNSVKLKSQTEQPLYCQQADEIIFSTHIGDVAECEVEYVPVDTDRIQRALSWLKENQCCYKKHVYLRAIVCTCAEEYFENYELSPVRSYRKNGEYLTYHDLFLELVAKFFKRKRLLLNNWQYRNIVLILRTEKWNN